VIGSVNISEWFVTILTIGEAYRWEIIRGLLVGGVMGAPLGAWLCQRIPTQRRLLLVGILIVVLSLRTLALAFVPA
jgi:uncharacterized membrane protein YfcA